MSDWTCGTIGDLATGVRGVSYRPEQLRPFVDAHSTVLLRSTNIQDGRINLSDIQIVPSAIVAEDQIVRLHDLVVCMSNGSKALVGKSARAASLPPFKLTVGAFCSVFHPKAGVCPSFVGHVFGTQSFRKNLDVVLAGSAINNLRNRDIESFSCRFPEPPEQQRIAAVLDLVDLAINSTSALIAKGEQIRAGLIHDLFTRGLDETGAVRDPLAQPEQFTMTPMGMLPRPWRPGKLDDLVQRDRPIVYGILMPGRGYRDGVPVVKVKDIREGRIDMSELLRTDPKIDAAYARSRLKPGDLLFSIRGTVGRMAIVPEALDGANITQDSARIALADADPVFVARWLELHAPRRFVAVHTLGVAVQGINLRDVRRIPVVIVPPAEQEAIVGTILAHERRIECDQAILRKLTAIKIGLSDDLLSKRVPIPTNRLEALEPV